MSVKRPELFKPPLKLDIRRLSGTVDLPWSNAGDSSCHRPGSLRNLVGIKRDFSVLGQRAAVLYGGSFFHRDIVKRKNVSLKGAVSTERCGRANLPGH